MLRQLAIGSLISIMFTSPAMANKFAADVTGAKTAPHLAVRKACPKLENARGKSYRAVMAKCLKARKPEVQLFVPDRSIGAPRVTQGSATR